MKDGSLRDVDFKTIEEVKSCMGEVSVIVVDFQFSDILPMVEEIIECCNGILSKDPGG